jgi:anti-sigma B factor antagonist
LLEREDIGDVTVIRINARTLLGDDTTEEIFRQINSLIDDAGRRKLILNLSSLEFLSSAAMGQLVILYRKSLAAQARLALCNVNSPVASILQVTHLADILISYADEREALRAFG